MKKILIALCLSSLVACANRADDDNAGDDDVVNPDPEPQPDPTPEPECVTDEDCTDAIACAAGVCENGACTYDTLCGDDEVCNEDLDVCEEKVDALPEGHRVRCFANNGTLYVTISGKLTDANYGGNLVAPTHVSLASDAIAGSWDTATPPTTYQVSLSSQETALGGVVSASIAVPQDLAQRFTLLIWPASGTAQRFDLSTWDVSGDTCARIADGSASGGASDGHIIGRAPLCPSACDDGNASTDDVCTPTGCTHSGAAPTMGSVSCAESGANTNVTISGGILDHLVASGASPDTTWRVRFGYGGTSSIAWQSDSTSYLLPMPSSVTEFNFVLENAAGTSQYWFSVGEFDTSGSCAKNGASTAFTHAAVSPVMGTIACSMTTVGGVPKRNLVLSPLSGHDIREGLSESPSFLPSPSVIQYGSDTDGWVLPYPAGSSKPQLSWTNGNASYSFYLDPAVNHINLFVVDNDDPADSVAGGDYLNLDKWNVTGTCYRSGGGISVN
ncbi:MAG TPA: hypothetical protein VL283_04480 [Candidatus Baltobacteraceae bacterium]|nr:hypothetical protein [Candidatus Baltobacteraceae bacterium]